MAVRSALRAGCVLLPRNTFPAAGIHFCYRLSKPRELVRPEKISLKKFSAHQVGVVEWCLNLLRYRVSQIIIFIFITCSQQFKFNLILCNLIKDRLCGLVVRVPGC
jgi:hypothetical protein